MSAMHPIPWTWEEHELSEGYSCIVYDASGQRVGGLDHLDRETAAKIAAADDLYAALMQLLNECVLAGFDTATDYLWPTAIADARTALAKARGEPV